MTPNITQITRLASQFRDAVIRAGVNEESNSWLGRFPRNCCGDASRLLGRLLFEDGIERISIVRGRINRDKATDIYHVWVQVDDIIVDVTADQFEGPGHPPVIVTRDSVWHNRFEIESARPFDKAYLNDLMTESYYELDRKLYLQIAANWNARP